MPASISNAASDTASRQNSRTETTECECATEQGHAFVFVLYTYMFLFSDKSNVCLCNTLQGARLRTFAKIGAVSQFNAQSDPIHLISLQEEQAVGSLWALDRTISFVYTALFGEEVIKQH